MVGKPERPSAFRRHRDRVHVEAAERAGRERGIVEQVSVVKLFHRHHRLRRGVRHGRELAIAADPDVAVAIGERRVEQRDVGLDRRQQHDRIVVTERIVDDLPVLATREHVGADQPA